MAISAFEEYLRLALAHGAVAAVAKPLDASALTRVVDDAARGAVQAPTVAAPARPDERERLRAILELQLDRPSPGDALDQLAERVARMFDVPVCLLSIVTRDRQYWHAHCGLPDDLAAARGTPRDESFCTHAVVAKAALIVQDTHDNPLFADNALVRTRGLRFYAGVPLVTSSGAAVGTLCLLDFRPRRFSADDLELLSILARRVVAELEWRERRLRPGAAAEPFRHLAWVDEELGVLGREAFEHALQVESLRAAQRRTSLALVVAAGEPLAAARAALETAFPRALVGRLAPDRVGALVPDLTGDEALHVARAALHEGAVARACEVPQLLGGVAEFLREAEQGATRAAPARG